MFVFSVFFPSQYNTFKVHYEQHGGTLHGKEDIEKAKTKYCIISIWEYYLTQEKSLNISLITLIKIVYMN